MDWYYMDGDRQVGPETDDAMTSLIRSGHVRRPTPVWRDGMPDWAEAGQTELAPYFVESVSPEPPPRTTSAASNKISSLNSDASKADRNFLKRLIGFIMFVVGLTLLLTGNDHLHLAKGLGAVGFWLWIGMIGQEE